MTFQAILSSEIYPMLTTLPTLASHLQILMALVNQTLAKLKDVKDIIFILWRVIAGLKVRDSLGKNYQ